MIPERQNTGPGTPLPYFVRHRFGERNQLDAGMWGDDSISEGIHCVFKGDEMDFILDYYSLERRDEANFWDFDIDAWEDMKQYVAFREVDAASARQAFVDGYRAARLLRRGVTITLSAADEPFTLLCAHYWDREKRRPLPSVARRSV